MPMRHYYYVLNPTGSTWEVRSSQDPTRCFASKEEAVAAARRACEERARGRQAACGVRIQHGIGDWVDDQPWWREDSQGTRSN